jgi:CRISPR-associated protein Cmr2
MTAYSYFHLTLGPVQGFVAQARRTRDFWAGSFILSWLVTVAMQAVEKQGGKVLFPLPDRQFMEALTGGSATLKQGNVPNRFKAEVPKDAFDPSAVEQAVQTAWQALAHTVWQGDFLDNDALTKQHLDLAKTEAIWQRQIKNFWEIQWAVIDSPTESNTLDRLKNWRTHLPAPEAGVKCMSMDGWQELSGVDSPIGEEGKKLKAFWQTLRASKTNFALDLREGEHLCAIAFVKRRFVHYFKNLRVEIACRKTAFQINTGGWTIPKAVPSVDYIAAAPWLADLLKKANSDKALNDLVSKFHETAFKLTGEYGEWENNLQCVKEVDAPHRWKALNGEVFFDFYLTNGQHWDKAANHEKARLSNETLQLLKQVRDYAQLDPVSPFYAILFMDGDSLGKQMSDGNKQAHITQGLACFTRQVEGIVEQHSGFLIYAGGDDVLALFPLKYAMPAALELRTTYDKIFAAINAERQADPDPDKRKPIDTSISAAIEYVHVKTPLAKVLHDAHDLLDKVAKDETGRDSIACRVWKQGGLQLQWSMPWRYAIDENNSNQLVLETIAKQFQQSQTKRNQAGNTPDPNATPNPNDQDVASKFFFTIRKRFDLLNPPEHMKESEKLVFDYGNALTSSNPNNGFSKAVKLMAMEYLNSGVARDKMTMPEAEKFLRPLLTQCLSIKRESENTADKDQSCYCYTVDAFKGLKADAALLVRFLAQKGIEKGRN